MKWAREAFAPNGTSKLPCPAGDGYIYVGQWCRAEYTDTGSRYWHDDCAEDYGMGPYGGVLHLQESTGVPEPERPTQHFRLRGLPQTEPPSLAG